MHLHHIKTNPKQFLGQDFSLLRSRLSCSIIETDTAQNMSRAVKFANAHNKHYDAKRKFYYFVTDEKGFIISYGKFNN